jgi:hypothetical protein
MRYLNNIDVRKMNELMKDDNLVDSRFPSSYSKEQMKYIRNQLVKKLTEESYEASLDLKEDKRFSVDQNQAIKEEVIKRVRDLKKKIIEKMEVLSSGIWRILFTKCFRIEGEENF